jgi:redox-sensitive bicupin YhaK (pirin superfamily)
MMTIRRAADRGQANHGWLDSRFTFSFAEYHDPQQMGFGVLRVINDDRIAGGGGFQMHGHRDMEIISYVTAGALEHRDSLGHSTVIYPGDVQRMSAGTGVQHSEFNHFKDQETHLFQIWILPDKKGYEPSYGQKSFLKELQLNRPVLVASHEAREGSIALNQNVDLWACKSSTQGEWEVLNKGRKFWIQVLEGSVGVGDLTLAVGDGLAVSDSTRLNVQWAPNSEFLLFDMA